VGIINNMGGYFIYLSKNNKMKKFNYYEGLIWAFFTAIMLTIALPTKAQMNYCDSIETNLSYQWWLQNNLWEVWFEPTIPTLNTPATVYYLWNIEHIDNDSTYFIDMDTVHTGMFYLDNTLYDSIEVCLSVSFQTPNNMLLCGICDTMIWDGNQWSLLSMVQPPLSFDENDPFFEQENCSCPAGLHTCNYYWGGYKFNPRKGIYDMRGRLVKSEGTYNKNNPLSGLPPGMYIVDGKKMAIFESR
tara:strand:- start:793 stop:1524 length:732 start_codon:yes stop_codon:yes gene_type:complete